MKFKKYMYYFKVFNAHFILIALILWSYNLSVLAEPMTQFTAEIGIKEMPEFLVEMRLDAFYVWWNLPYTLLLFFLFWWLAPTLVQFWEKKIRGEKK